MPPRLPSRVVLAAACLIVLIGCAPKRVLRQLDPLPEPTPRGEVGRPSTPLPLDAEPTAPADVSPVRVETPPTLALQRGVQAATLARDQVGRPYRWGGEDPGAGFDCSGLVRWSFGCVGVELPRMVEDQHAVGQVVGGDDLRPGDLVFFRLESAEVSHVGVYLGAGRFVHAPRRGQPVREDSLDDPWWRERWIGSRRVTGD